MERLKVKSIQGTAKLVGITVCMGGVITLALYKGPLLKLPLCPHFYHGQEHPHHNNPGHVSGGSTSWLKGCVLMITSNILWGLWLVLQVSIQIAPHIIITLMKLLYRANNWVLTILLETRVWTKHLRVFIMQIWLIVI